jgi:hypothetical protein
MSPNKPAEVHATQADEQALGHLMLSGLRAIAGDWKTWIGVVGGTGIVGLHLLSGTTSARPEDMRQLVAGMAKLNRGMTEVKITTKALVDSMPPQQRDRAKALIADRMAVLHIVDQEGQP